MQQLKFVLQKKRYLYTALILVLLVGIFISWFVVNSINKVISSFTILKDFASCVDNTNKTTISAKEFLLTAYTNQDFHKTGQNAQLNEFNERHDMLINKLLIVKKNRNFEFKNDSVLNYANQYKDCFYRIVQLTKEKGYKDMGLEGEMRKSIHQIENFSFLPDLKPLLSLRRHEKDFLLRKDLKYLKTFDEESGAFSQSILSNPNLTEDEKAQITSQLSSYQSIFHQIVKIESEIGFSEADGLRERLARLRQLTDQQLAFAQNELNQQASIALNQVQVVVWIIIALLILFVVIGGSIYYIIRKDVQKPLQELNQIADKISAGNLQVEFGALNKSVFINELALAIERIVNKFSTSIAIMEGVSNRKKFVIENEFSKDDHVGQVLIRISKEIENMTLEQEERDWHSKSINKINLVLKEQDSLSVFCDDVLKTLVQILRANQAVLFLVEDGEKSKVLKMASSYAYGRKKYMEQAILPGEGLAGQCYLEKESSLITDVPGDYLKIRSGLGDATPRCLLLIPFLHNGEVVAVLEIASFQFFKKVEIEFLEKSGETIASALYFIQVNENTRKLLEISKLQTSQLQAQEEEMRQNIEELSATQEALLRSNILEKAENTVTLSLVNA